LFVISNIIDHFVHNNEHSAKSGSKTQPNTEVMDKERQKRLLTEIMEADAKDGFYSDAPPFRHAFVRQITDSWERGEISYGKMVELFNEIAMTWHKLRTVSKMETTETWEDIEQEYLKEEYPVFGGPFNAMSPFEWLKKYYYSPKRK
jgi:hypothetical protein